MYKSVKQIASELLIESLVLNESSSRGPGVLTLSPRFDEDGVQTSDSRTIPFDYLEVRSNNLITVGIGPGSFPTKKETRRGIALMPSFATVGPYVKSNLYAKHGNQKARQLLEWADSIVELVQLSDPNYDNYRAADKYATDRANSEIDLNKIREEIRAKHAAENAARSVNDDPDAIDDFGDDFGHQDRVEAELMNHPAYIDYTNRVKKYHSEYKPENVPQNKPNPEDIKRADEIIKEANNGKYWPVTLKYRTILTINPANIASIQ